jgi:hypothetical protein
MWGLKSYFSVKSTGLIMILYRKLGEGPITPAKQAGNSDQLGSASKCHLLSFSLGHLYFQQAALLI